MIRFRFLLAPHVTAKIYLLLDMYLLTKTYAFRGNILDIGCGEKSYKYLFKDSSSYTGIDFNLYSINPTFTKDTPDIYFPKKYFTSLRLPFKNNSYDMTVSFQVLEHHKDPKKMIQEMVRVTHPGGYILVTAPFIWSLHEKPTDYTRITGYGIHEYLTSSGCRVLVQKKEGSLPSVIAILAMDYLIEIAQKSKFLYVLCFMVSPFFLIAVYASFLLDKIFPSENIYLNNIILPQKKK